ncbi:LCP family protein [Streptomyces sp. NPDC002055]|uniref:LCP family protein n=1 Tax=Streptomyces sp. NPDC002055 TaxID=3154534 RepID=UPI00332545CA
MADEGTTASGSGPGRIRPTGRRRKVHGTRRKVLTVVAWSAAGAAVLSGAGLGYAYFQLNGNLKGVDINSALGTDRPKNADNGSMDILLMGSDSRQGTNGKYGDDGGGARADTAMVLHVSKGHKKASVVSIPRDTIVSRPECRKTGGGTSPAAERAMFNESYQIGGPACSVKTVEKLSGIRMDHYLEVDFTGFKKLIDKLGGVPVTTGKPIQDKSSRLDLQPGRHTLDGEQALGLVRTRHAVGDGSDLGRIQLQQAFVKALIHQAENVDLFGSPSKLYGLADTATRTVTTDSSLASVDDLLGFAKGLQGIGPKDMNMVTMPVTYDPADPNRVIPLEKKGAQVWEALRKDRPIPESATKGAAGDKADASKVVKSS